MSLIDPHKLHPNPGNTIFDPLPTDVYAALKADIAARGLLNPILCTSDYTVIAGHHRLKAALELGLNQVPVDVQDVDAAEAEDRLIADNVLRRQLSLGEQAKLIHRLKERADIRRGPKGQRRAISAIMAEIPELAHASERKRQRLDHATQLIPPLFALFNGNSLPLTVADALAGLPPDDQQALLDVLGAEQMSTLKATDIQSARREATPSHTESEIQAILGRVKELQAQKNALEQRLATVEDQPDPDLLDRLETAETEREALEEEVTRLRNQPPTVVEKLVEKLVPVDQPDPAQVARMAELSQSLETTQAELTLLKTRRKDLLHYEQERDRLQAEAAGIKNELARLRDSTNVARYRLAQAVDIAAILRKILDQGLADVPKLEALLADSEGAILPTDRELARNVAEQLQRASDLILTAVRQFTTPVITPTDPFDPNDSTIQLLKEAHVLDDDHSIITPGD